MTWRASWCATASAFGVPWDEMPVFGTSAARFDDDGVTALYHAAAPGCCATAGCRQAPVRAADGRRPGLDAARALVPPQRARYLAEIAQAVRGYHRMTGEQAALARRLQHLRTAQDELRRAERRCGSGCPGSGGEAAGALLPETTEALAAWPGVVEQYSGDDHSLHRARQGVPHPAAAHDAVRHFGAAGGAAPTTDHGDLVRFLREENLPGGFPYTAGVFPFKRTGEAPARMFAGEGDPFRTNRRFHLLAAGQPATRLSTAFDSVTLYGRDPGPSPDVYGKVGTSGVSIATLDDMRELYAGFDLCAPRRRCR